MVSPLLSAGAAAATTFIPNFKIWQLRNLDSGQVLQGQFEPENVTRDVGANWGQFTSLNRQKAILQFLNGANETLSFDGRFFRNHALDNSPEEKLELLISWSRIDPSVRRPPILQFWIGDGHIRGNCVISGITANYGRPDFFGALRDVGFSVSLLEFSTFSIDDVEETDTRYAHARERDYFELLAFEEYGNPMLGDVIRKQHPQLQNLEPGDIVRLPSIEGVRTIQVTQTSIPLKTAFGRADTPQRRLRLQFFDKRSGNYTSHRMSTAKTSGRGGF
jgi:hypothetical protein